MRNEEVQRLRADTPGCQERIHLNNAGAGLMPKPVVAAIKDHIDLEARIGGYEAEDAQAEALKNSYAAMGAPAAPRDPTRTTTVSALCGVLL